MLETGTLEHRAKSENVDQGIRHGVKRQAAGEQERQALGDREHTQGDDERRNREADDERAIAKPKQQAGEDHGGERASQTGIRQGEDADDARARHHRGHRKIESAAQKREELADHDDLQRGELTRQVLCVGDRPEMRFAQTGGYSDRDHQKR